MLNPAYETKTMLAPFKAGPLVPTFLRDTFFGAREYPQTPLIEFDFRRGRRKMAPFVAPLVGGKLMERQGFETRFFRAPRIAPVRALRTPDLEARMMGETIYSTRSPADRAAELLAEDAIFCDEAITRREEWMCRNVLVNGAITVTADTGYQMVIDFTQSSAGAANNHYIPTVKWDVASGSDPLADLEAARLATIKDSGIAPNVALMGVNAAKVFIRNPQVAALLNKLQYSIATIQPVIQAPNVVLIGQVPGMQVFEYADYFEDDTGTIFPMLPDNFVMLLSTNTPNKIAYGAFTQLEDAKAKRFVTYTEPRIPFVYGDEEGGSLFYRLTSCPLPMPADILGFRIIEALALTFPAMVEGDAVLNSLTGEITGDEEEANKLKQEAADKAAKNKTRGSSANWPDDPDKPKSLAEKNKGKSGNAGGGNPGNGGGDDLESHTVDELKDIAAQEGVELAHDARKHDIIKAIEKNRKQK